MDYVRRNAYALRVAIELNPVQILLGNSKVGEELAHGDEFQFLYANKPTLSEYPVSTRGISSLLQLLISISL
jgi:hypothetical protein